MATGRRVTFKTGNDELDRLFRNLDQRLEDLEDKLPNNAKLIKGVELAAGVRTIVHHGLKRSVTLFAAIPFDYTGTRAAQIERHLSDTATTTNPDARNYLVISSSVTITVDLWVV